MTSRFSVAAIVRSPKSFFVAPMDLYQIGEPSAELSPNICALVEQIIVIHEAQWFGGWGWMWIIIRKGL